MRVILIFIFICALLCNSCSGSGKSDEQINKEPSQGRLIYYKQDSSGKPMYYISEALVPDSIWREKLGKALVTVYLGKKWWSEDQNTFREAGPIGIKVLIEASRVIENDDGNAAIVLRNLGNEGCIAMINYLKTSMENNERVSVYFIEELGNARYKNAIEVLSLVLKYNKGLPEEKVASAIALSKLGDYRGLDVLRKMRSEKSDLSWQQWIDKSIKIIGETRSK